MNPRTDSSTGSFRLPSRLAIMSVTAALLVVGGATVAAAMRTGASDPPSPATGHAEVIAQSVVELGDGAYQWTATPHVVDAAGTSLTADLPTFLLAGAGSAVALTGSDGDWLRLAGGEAAFRPAGSATQASSLGATAASLTALALGPGDATEPLTPGAGAHDVDLLRDVLAPGETFTLTAQIPAFVLVTDGSVDDGQGSVLDAGATTTLQGDIALTNTADAPAVVVAAVIGPTLDTATATSPPATDTTGSTPPPASNPQDESTVPNLVPIPTIPPGLLTTTTLVQISIPPGLLTTTTTDPFAIDR